MNGLFYCPDCPNVFNNYRDRNYHVEHVHNRGVSPEETEKREQAEQSVDQAWENGRY